MNSQAEYLYPKCGEENVLDYIVFTYIYKMKHLKDESKFKHKINLCSIYIIYILTEGSFMDVQHFNEPVH